VKVAPEFRIRRYLELRWRWFLPRGKIPGGLWKSFVRSERFERMMGQVKAGGVTFVDLAGHGRFVRRADGLVEDQLVAELGDDPFLWACSACMEDVRRGQEYCDPCREFIES
jgi:hypothetical protein